MDIKNIRKLRWFILTLNLFFLVCLFLLIRYKLGEYPSQGSKPLPVYGRAPAFSLTERSGRQISESDLTGNVWIADFIFTRCAGQCPIMSQQMSRLHKKLKEAHFVSFSVDPEFDSPGVLAHYANSYHADPHRWLFLTGDKAMLNHLTAGFHMNKIDEPAFHNVSFILIDKKGQVRGFYDAQNEELTRKLEHDAKYLLKQKA